MSIHASSWTEEPGRTPGGYKESDMTERLSLAAENRFEVYQTVPHGISI